MTVFRQNDASRAGAQRARRGEVGEELERRLRSIALKVPGDRVITLAAGEGDVASLGRLHAAAERAVAGGRGDERTKIRTVDNQIIEPTWRQVSQLLARYADAVQSLYEAAWALKDAESIPDDFRADRYWQSRRR